MVRMGQWPVSRAMPHGDAAAAPLRPRGHRGSFDP